MDCKTIKLAKFSICGWKNYSLTMASLTDKEP